MRVTSTTNKVQLVSEAGGVATPATTYELNSAPFPAGQDVRLVLRAADTAGSGGTSRRSTPSTAALSPSSPTRPTR